MEDGQQGTDAGRERRAESGELQHEADLRCRVATRGPALFPQGLEPCWGVSKERRLSRDSGCKDACILWIIPGVLRVPTLKRLNENRVTYSLQQPKFQWLKYESVSTKLNDGHACY